MDKNKIRNKIINQLKNIPLKERALIEENLYRHLFHSFLWKNVTVIGITISHSFEWNTNPIIDQAWKEKKVICIPKSNKQTKDMEFYQHTPDSVLQTGYAAIQEPDPETAAIIRKDQIELLIVPGIVFDNRGYRIGFGGGFYDRYLIGFMSPTVSLLSTKQLIPEINREPHDIPVKYLITENGWIRTGKAD